MKKFIMMVATAMMVCSLSAQEAKEGPQRGHGRGPEQFDKAEMVQKQTDWMVKRYKLSDKQAQQVKELNEKYADKFNLGGMRPGGNRQGGPGERGPRMDGGQRPDRQQLTPEQREAMRAEMQKIRAQREEDRAAYNAALKEILSKKQFSSYETDQEALREKMMQNRGQRPMGRGNWGD
jgi:Spy/CpxP family protein refolding chaperone